MIEYCLIKVQLWTCRIPVDAPNR